MGVNNSIGNLDYGDLSYTHQAIKIYVHINKQKNRITGSPSATG